MAILTNLFGESPFGALESHGVKVHECVRLLKDLYQAFKQEDQTRLREIARRIFDLETEADKVRNHLHEMLASKVMMPISKIDLFNILEQQDSMADRAEDIAATLTYRDMKLPANLAQDIEAYLDRILRNCELAGSIMSKFDILAEASFAGRDAATVSRLITELSERENATKTIEIELTRKFLTHENELPPVETMLWLQIIGFITDLSKFADRTGNGIRLILQIKPGK